MNRSLVLVRILWSFLIATPLVIFSGLLNGLGVTGWIVLIAFMAVLMVFCGVLWAIYEVRQRNRLEQRLKKDW